MKGRTGDPSEDHPRVCGENLIQHISPRQELGITPAYAGRTLLEIEKQILNPDHPRVCGENVALSLNVIGDVGSPPRMRGERLWGVCMASSDGITPAYAGRTRRPLSVLVGLWDHPRVCGENH